MACIWYGVQAWIGGECVYLMIASIWPSFGQRPNLTGSISMGGTVNYLISFIIFWLGSLPFLWFPVHKIRHLFTVKAFVAPTAGIALFVWVTLRAGGPGPIIHRPATVSGSKLAWGVIAGIMSAVSNFATLIVNDPDFARFASKPSDAFLPQLITIPMGFGLTSFIGIIVGSSSAVIYPQQTRNLEPTPTPGQFHHQWRARRSRKLTETEPAPSSSPPPSSSHNSALTSPPIVSPLEQISQH